MSRTPPTFNVELNPKQGIFIAALRDLVTRHIGYGGAKKSGKSFILRFALIMRCILYPGTMHLLLRRSYREVMSNHESAIKKLCFQFGIAVKFKADGNYFEFPEYCLHGEPSRLYLGYAESLDDADRYAGIEWLTIGFEECCQMLWLLITRIVGEAMQSIDYPDAMLKILYTCNPIGVSKDDFKRHVVDEHTRMPNTVWIPGDWRDNIHFARVQPDYDAFLMETHKDQPWLIEALLHGSWTSDPYRFYSCFDPTPGGKHVRAVKVPYWADFFAGVDYGYSPTAFAVVWCARWQEEDGRERLHVMGDVKAFYQDEDEQAELALAREMELGFPPPPYSIRYADPATKKKDPKESDEVSRSTARIWATHGFVTKPANRKHKYTGEKLVRRLLRGKEPILTIDPGARALIREMDIARHETRPDGSISSLPDPKQPDDSRDCLRYVVVMTFFHLYKEAVADEDWADEVMQVLSVEEMMRLADAA